MPHLGLIIATKLQLCLISLSVLSCCKNFKLIRMIVKKRIFDPGLKVIKLFSCSTQVSLKLKQLINSRIAKINGNFRFKSQKLVFIPPVYEVYRGYIVFVFSVCLCVCVFVNFFFRQRFLRNYMT